MSVEWIRTAAHRAVQYVMPPRTTPVFLPVSSPELNPMDPIWRALRKKLANQLFETLAALEAAASEALREF